MKKIFCVCLLLIVLFIVPMLFNKTEASSDELNWKNIKKQTEQFIKKGGNETFNTADNINAAASILTTIGVVIILSGLLIFGIKYMLATPDEAAKIKSKLIGLVIAGVIILGAFGIWQVTMNVLASMTNTDLTQTGTGATTTPTPNKTPGEATPSPITGGSGTEETSTTPTEKPNSEDEPEQEDFDEPEDMDEEEKPISNKGSTSTGITEIILNRIKVPLYVGAKFKLKYSLKPSGTRSQDITFSSDDPEIATVSKGGTIKAKSEGTTYVRATAKNGVYTTVKVIVSNSKIKPTSITLNKTSAKLDLDKKETVKLRYRILPAEANYKNEVTFTSEDKKVAVVSAEGLVTPKGVGETIITATTGNNKVAKIKITVTAKPTATPTPTKLKVKDSEFIEAKELALSGKQTYIYIPTIKGVENPTLPLIVYLHGQENPGYDMGKNDTFPKMLANKELQPAAIIVSPRDTEVVKNYDSTKSWIKKIVKYCAENYNIKIDENRVSLTGHSAGTNKGVYALLNQNGKNGEERIFSAAAFLSMTYVSGTGPWTCDTPTLFLFETNHLGQTRMEQNVRNYRNAIRSSGRYEKYYRLYDVVGESHNGVPQCYKFNSTQNQKIRLVHSDLTSSLSDSNPELDILTWLMSRDRNNLKMDLPME